MSRHSGQCLCGTVRFSASALGGFGACHCSMCQHWSGGPHFGITVAEADMVIKAGAEAIGSYRSSPAASRFWCSRCGSGLWTRTDGGETGRGDFEVNFGLLDAPGDIALSREIFIDRKPGGYALAGTHERLTEAETIARFGLSTEGE